MAHVMNFGNVYRRLLLMFAHCLPKSINPKNNEEGWFGSRGGDGNFDRRGEQEQAGASGSQVSGKSRTWQRVMMMGLARSVVGKGREGGREAESRVRNS